MMAATDDGRRPGWAACLFGVALAVGCSADDVDLDPIGRSGEIVSAPKVSEVPAPLPAAHCDVDVEGTILDLETEYLPNVVRCENGGANLEALKAQAIAARSVAYYSMETSGTICDSQGCQVYSCGGSAEAIHIQAVQETSGMYLKYGDILTYGFYVAGDSGVSSPSCVGTPGAASTEHWITYNDGKSGTDVEQTDLGYVHDPSEGGYGQNRGCMGQWSARCLENDLGYDYVEILQFFYGSDIEIVQAEGECVMSVDPPADDGGDSGGSDDGVVDGGSDGGADADAGGDAGDGPADSGDGAADDAGADAGADGQADDFGDSDDGIGGTGGGGGAALPDTYGPDPGAPQGCACTTDERRPPLPLLVLIPLIAIARRRRARSRAR